MKMKRLFILGVVLVSASITHAADILKVQDVEMAPGESVTLNIELNNTTTNLMGWQCDISLPEGLTLELKDNGKPAATLGDRFSTTEHTISSNRLSNGDYRFIATSIDGEAIPGTSGTLFTVTLKADASLTIGTKLTGTIKNVEFNTQDNHKLIFDEVKFSVVMDDISVIPGDANDDKKVDAEDIVTITEYMMGKEPENYIIKNADVNGDGIINIADIIQITNQILSKE